MFFSQEVEDLRAFYFDVWRKLQAGEQLLPLEQQIANVLRDHPEFQSVLGTPDRSKSQQFYPELGQTNPFLHMGLHLAIREQVSTDRPQGIADVHRGLVQSLGDAHAAEHAMI